MDDQLETTCPNCGAVLPTGLESCSHCGALLAQPEVLDTEVDPLTGEELAPALASEPENAPPELPEPVAGSPLRINRKISAMMKLKIRQETVDGERWLSEAQWERVLELYQAALADRMLLGMEAGQPLDPAPQSTRVLVPWDQVGDDLTDSQRAEIENGLHQLLGARLTGPARGSAGCMVLMFIIGLLAAGATFYATMHH